MGKGKINKANQQENSLNGNEKEWDFLLWVGGGILAHFPFLFALLGIFLLKNANYKKLLKDYLTGGELLWISAVFLITTMGYLLTDFLNPPKRSNVSTRTKRRIALLCSGGLMFLFCFAGYVVRKGQPEPLPAVSSVILWILSISISIGLIKVKET
jgi:hypothetical protein